MTTNNQGAYWDNARQLVNVTGQRLTENWGFPTGDLVERVTGPHQHQILQRATFTDGAVLEAYHHNFTQYYQRVTLPEIGTHKACFQVLTPSAADKAANNLPRRVLTSQTMRFDDGLHEEILYYYQPDGTLSHKVVSTVDGLETRLIAKGENSQWETFGRGLVETNITPRYYTVTNCDNHVSYQIIEKFLPADQQSQQPFGTAAIRRDVTLAQDAYHDRTDILFKDNRAIVRPVNQNNRCTGNWIYNKDICTFLFTNMETIWQPFDMSPTRIDNSSRNFNLN